MSGSGGVGGKTGISDGAVRKATGKSWAEWCRILDKAGAKKMSHKEIARHLYEKESMPPWWGQMVTVGYERVRGLREMHQKPDGYSVSASRTVAVPVSRLYAAWADAKRRATWLKDSQFTVRKATKPKSMRVTWLDGKTNVDINFLAKGATRSSVAVEHSKLASAREVARIRTYWGRQLDQLKKLLES